jgi:hypothetical protein
MVMLLTVLCLSPLGGESFPASLAAERLRDMLQRAHEERDGARLVARKLSVESALLPAFIVQDLAHGCASQDMASSMSYTYGAADAERCAGWVWPLVVSCPAAPIEPGWTCPAGMVWRVRATTERLVCAGPEPAVAIDWIIESDGTSTSAITERFEPALMPAELDFPLVPWGLSLHWDRERGHALDHSGQSHTESWRCACSNGCHGGHRVPRSGRWAVGRSRASATLRKRRVHRRSISIMVRCTGTIQRPSRSCIMVRGRTAPSRSAQFD